MERWSGVRWDGMGYGVMGSGFGLRGIWVRTSATLGGSLFFVLKGVRSICMPRLAQVGLDGYVLWLR
jgi:hypothetical protein